MANLTMRYMNSRWNLPYQYTHTVVYGQTGSGKCIDENTKIKISINKKIKNIKIKDLPKHFEVVSYNFNKKEKEIKRAIKTYSGEKDCYEITLKNNKKIIATKDHRVFDEKGKEIRVKNLKVGDNLIEIK